MKAMGAEAVLKDIGWDDVAEGRDPLEVQYICIARLGLFVRVWVCLPSGWLVKAHLTFCWCDVGVGLRCVFFCLAGLTNPRNLSKYLLSPVSPSLSSLFDCPLCGVGVPLDDKQTNVKSIESTRHDTTYDTKGVGGRARGGSEGAVPGYHLRHHPRLRQGDRRGVVQVHELHGQAGQGDGGLAKKPGVQV